MPLVSVIVPIYNVEKYLNRCIDSILSQSFWDYELLLIDDGSSDKSGVICDEYFSLDDRVAVIHTENSGVSSARNIGINLAKGEFIAFIDADDFLEEQYFEKLLNKKADIMICNAWYTNPDGSTNSKVMELTDSKDLVSDNKVLKWYENGIMYSVWGRLFRLDIIRKYELYFDTNTTRGEDTIFMFNYIEKCHDVCFLSQPLYYYVRYTWGGSSSNKLSEQNIRALNYLDCYISNWLQSRNMRSSKFESIQYWTKSEQIGYFWRVYYDSSLKFFERVRWYNLFFSLPNFYKNLDEFFSKESSKFLFVIKRRSGFLLSIMQLFAKR